MFQIIISIYNNISLKHMDTSSEYTSNNYNVDNFQVFVNLILVTHVCLVYYFRHSTCFPLVISSILNITHLNQFQS